MIARTRLAGISAVLAGALAPALGMVALAGAASAAQVAAPVIAAGMMGAGMIAAAASGRWWTGAALAAVSGLGLAMLALALGIIALPHLAALLLAISAASTSFAARGALFARSAGERGWWIAVALLAGEGAMLAVAAMRPGAVPDGLLALLPAQWASMATAAALVGEAAPAALLALAGTGATTMLVAHLWPARWPYVVMFSAWLALSALVWHGLPTVTS